jgi:hypothetical protein
MARYLGIDVETKEGKAFRWIAEEALQVRIGCHSSLGLRGRSLHCDRQSAYEEALRLHTTC